MGILGLPLPEPCDDGGADGLLMGSDGGGSGLFCGDTLREVPGVVIGVGNVAHWDRMRFTIAPLSTGWWNLRENLMISQSASSSSTTGTSSTGVDVVDEVSTAAYFAGTLDVSDCVPVETICGLVRLAFPLVDVSSLRRTRRSMSVSASCCRRRAESALT